LNTPLKLRGDTEACPCGSRGKMRKAEVDPSFPPIITDEISFVPSRGWAEMNLLLT